MATKTKKEVAPAHEAHEQTQVNKTFERSRIMQIDFNKIFDYDNGKLYWKIKIADKIIVGSEAGYLDKKINRHVIGVFGVSLYRSRIIYAMFNKFSHLNIDHINRITTDDRIENLREVTTRENGINVDRVINNTRNLPPCVYFDPTNKKNHYYVRARVNGKKKVIGWAKTPELAESLYKKYFNISI